MGVFVSEKLDARDGKIGWKRIFMDLLKSTGALLDLKREAVTLALKERKKSPDYSQSNLLFHLMLQ